jgi:hypothetical protein
MLVISGAGTSSAMTVWCEPNGYSLSGSHRNPSPQRVIRPHDGDGKCVPQHSVPVSQ